MKPQLSPCALLLSTLILAACAAEPSVPANTAGVASAASDGSSEMFCSREYPTGSNIAVTICRTKEQVAAEKAAGTENLRRSQTGGPNAKPGGG
jgi:hypothetical protein